MRNQKGWDYKRLGQGGFGCIYKATNNKYEDCSLVIKV